TASTFGAIGLSGFDDRDGQFLIGYDTGAQVPAHLGTDHYRVLSARLTARIAADQVFLYDPTFDALGTYLPENDPRFVTHSDSGRPIEPSGVGFRNGWPLLTFQETSPFGGTPLVQPAEGARNNFAANFDSAGVATDVSRNVRLGFEVSPFAIGTTTQVA